jgi:hypothetical protein
VTFAVPGARLRPICRPLQLQALPSALPSAEPEAGLDEMRRVTRRGGAVAACVWDYPGEMNLLPAFWDAAGELDSDGVQAVDEQCPTAASG